MRRSLLPCIACFTAVMFLLSRPVLAIADELSFVPTIVDTAGDLGINASSQHLEYSLNGTRSDSSARFLSESLDVSADGFIYHPRFEVFLAKMSGALNQWDTQGTGPFGYFRSSESTLNYEFRTTFLPEHPYNLELFALHKDTAAPQNFWFGQQGDLNTKGAIFTFKYYPFFFHMSYNDSTIDSNQNRTDTVAYRVNGTLRGDIMNQTASYTHTDSQSALLMHSMQQDYGYFNSIAYNDLRLFSRISNRTTDQTTPPDRGLHMNSFDWSERFTTPLPWNFSTDLSYFYRDENDRSSNGAPGAAPVEQFNRSTNAAIQLTHHLYQSLVTTFIANRMQISSSLGDITSDTWTLNAAYTKLTPPGRLVVSGNYGETESEHAGTALIINELHNAVIGPLGTFTLSSQNIALTTVSIQVKDPPSGIWMTLPPGNYVVTQMGNTLQVTVLSVAPATPQPPGFVYEFQASYALVNESKISMTMAGYSLDADLIRDRLSGYFAYNRSEQDVVSGSLPGGPDVMVTEAAGLRAHKGPLSGHVERQVVRSRLTPWEAWKADAQYRNRVAEDIGLFAGVSGAWYDYLPASASTGYRATTNGVDLGMDVRFPTLNLALFVNASYFTNRSTIDSDTMTFNSYLTWQKGLLSVNGGAQVNQIDTTYTTNKTSAYSDYLYLTVTRKLF